MNNMKRPFLTIFVSCFLLSMQAQSLTIIDSLKYVPFSSVTAKYKNLFEKHFSEGRRDSFPYSLIRMRIEGTESEVLSAKEHLSLYLGTYSSVEETIKTIDNELLFLVPSNFSFVYVTCGEGCKRQCICYDNPRPKSNIEYTCSVHYEPEQEVYGSKKQKITQQYLVMKVNPPEALVYVDDTLWNVDVMDSIATKKVSFGKHQYRVELRGYHEQTGTIIVGENKTNLQVSLNPAFGWLSIPGNGETKGATVYIDSRVVGTIPMSRQRIPSGTHTIRILQPKYNSFEKDFTINDGQEMSLDVNLEANFSNVELTALPNAQILIDGKNVGTENWSGNLESGEYLVEVQLEHHYPVSYKLKVSPNMAQKAITLPSPMPKLGALEITSSPQTATIFLDGKDIGRTTPDGLRDIVEGTHTILLKKSGYSDYSTTVDVKENETAIVTANLQSSVSIEISVRDNNKADIYLKASDENQYKFMGAGSFKGELPIGKYNVKISFTNDYEENLYDLNVSAETHKDYPAPKLKTRSFVIKTKPSNGQISIDNGASYSSPSNYTLTYGQHNLHISKHKYDAVDKTIMVGPNTSDMLIKLNRHRTYQHTYFCVGMEFAYDHQFIKIGQNKDGQPIDTPLKSSLDGFHFGPDFYIEAQPCGMGLHFGLYYQYLERNGYIFNTKEQNEDVAKQVASEKNTLKGIEFYRSFSVYCKTQRHSFQIPLELMYSYRKYGDMDGGGFTLHAGALFDVGLRHWEATHETAVVKNYSDGTWISDDKGNDITGKKVGFDYRKDCFTGMYITKDWDGVHNVDVKKEQQQPSLSRYDIKLGGGIDFQYYWLRVGVEYYHGMLNQIHPNQRTATELSNGIVNNLWSGQLSLRINCTFPTNY